jgi:hypothetical protein
MEIWYRAIDFYLEEAACHSRTGTRIDRLLFMQWDSLKDQKG